MGEASNHTLLTVDEVAARLKCHPHTVRRWIWRRKLKAVKVGDLVRVPEDELAQLIRPLHGPGRKASQGAPALLATMEDLRKVVDPADVDPLERALAEAEQPADWTNPVG